MRKPHFTRLARIAQVRLGVVARGPADGEDVAFTAFESPLEGVAAGGFPGLGNRDDMWRLLVAITTRKVRNQGRNACSQKRGAIRNWWTKLPWPEHAPTVMISWTKSSATSRPRIRCNGD